MVAVKWSKLEQQKQQQTTSQKFRSALEILEEMTNKNPSISHLKKSRFPHPPIHPRHPMRCFSSSSSKPRSQKFWQTFDAFNTSELSEKKKRRFPWEVLIRELWEVMA